MASFGQVLVVVHELRYPFDIFIFSASSDETVQILEQPQDPSSKPAPPITHPVAVRAILPLPLTDLAEPYIITGAGDIIRIYDVSNPDEPELIGEIDAHWHDVTALRIWVRKTTGDDGKTRVEPWIISASLDATIRKWRLQGLAYSHCLLKDTLWLSNNQTF